MPIKIVKASALVHTCVNCGNVRAKHGEEGECPLKSGGHSKKSKYCNKDDRGWRIEQALKEQQK